jgi:Ca2+-binding EF-hand superfamily protein
MAIAHHAVNKGQGGAFSPDDSATEFQAEIHREGDGKKHMPTHSECAKDIFQRFDKDHSKKLDRGQVANLLAAMNSNRRPTDDELDFVFKIANARGDGAIHSTEMCTLLSCWENYLAALDEINLHFLKHDPDHTGRLNKDQMWNLMSELAGKHTVTAAEVDMVVKRADLSKDGTISKPELRRALALWANYLQRIDRGCCTLQ